MVLFKKFNLLLNGYYKSIGLFLASSFCLLGDQ